ncbi:MAG TPA: NAD(P)/FAD-dependent oxidoreductase [Ktedonobacteraceae bacterium]|nr:NAD(P)/FAD-dependent oxidoreductase [Ktedonobacteraceae bacterium]
MSQTFLNGNQATEEASNGDSSIRHVRVAILGTGFSGLGMAIRLKQRGEHDFVVFEKASDIGGTWRDNTYPGCACDIPSHLYSFSFALNPRWSHAYSRQPEIWDYLRRCAKRYGIMPHIQWNCEMQDATWDEDEQRWHITTSQGRFSAALLILGYGPLSEPRLPAIPGIEDFEGVMFHSAQWKHDYDLTGKHVAVIGTGASAIQFVPQIQSKVGHISLFLRTPPWILPRLDHPIRLWKQNMYRLLPFTQRMKRARIYSRLEIAALGLVYRPQGLDAAMNIARQHLEKQVPDPILRAKLIPDYTLGCKRILLSDDFYPSLSQPNVEVISDRIREVRAHSVVAEDGREFEVDTIICGTGFHVTDSQLPYSVYGLGGQSLGERWRDGASAYLGATVSGFPNMFLLIGPNTGLGHNSMVYMIESQITYILDCIGIMDRKHIQAIEVRADAQETFNAELQQRMGNTVWKSGCTSWYLDAHGRNTTLWPGFTFEFRRRTRRFDPQNYLLSAKVQNRIKL